MTVSKRELPFYIKYGISIPGLFAAAEGNTFICGQWREGERAGGLGDEVEEDRKNGKMSILAINFSLQTNNGQCLWTKEASSGIQICFCHVSRVERRRSAEEMMGRGVYYK